MKQFKQDIPLYLNGLFAGLLLTVTDPEPLSLQRLIWWGCIGLTTIWYGYNKEKQGKSGNP